MDKLSKILFALVILIVPFSCTDLEEDLRGNVVDDISIPGIDTGSDGENSGPLTAAYAELRNAGTANHGGYYSVQELPSDEMVICAKGGDWFDGGILIQLHQHTYGSTHDFVNGTWVQTYNAIGSANAAVANPALDASQIAQARVLRAYFHWRLLDLYGNVKIITGEGADAPQSSRAEVFEFVESEYLDVLGISSLTAGADLSSSPLSTDPNTFEINQFAVLGLLSKLYLNAEVYTGTPRYEEAAIAASIIIDSGVYSLCGDGCMVVNQGKRPSVDSDPDMLEGYPAVFAPNNDANPEHIWVVNYDEVTGGNMNFSQMNLHYSSQFSYNLQSQPWNGYATLEEFYNSYEDGDARKAANFLVGEQVDFGGSAILDFASDDGNLVLNYTPFINELQPNSIREAGARPAKFSFKQLGRNDMNNNYPIVRLGDVYLMRGEAMARMSGNWNAALPDVNLIRARAKVSELTSLDADIFLAERGREMFQEATRRTDQIRFGVYNDTWWEKPVSQDFVNIYPIPFDQLQATSGGAFPLTQNPGYN
jgi:hypothetical protein